MKRWFTVPRRILTGLCVSLFGAICVLMVARESDDTTLPVLARPTTAESAPASLPTQWGKASYYGLKYQGRPTASGEIFDVEQFTAAHRTLAFGTRVRVTNLANDRPVVVRINDRGPFVEGRIIDLSQAAAEQLQMIQEGVVDVKIEIVE